MTFDEALNELEPRTIWSSEMRDLLEQLRQEYAPTVEMTKAQNEAFVESVDGIATQERLDSFVDEELDLADDPAIEFKVKETLYRLWRIDDYKNTVYMDFGIAGTPTYTPYENRAFTAPLEEIKKWQTPAWEIEEAD